MDPVQQLLERRLVLVEDAEHGVFFLAEISPDGLEDLRLLDGPTGCVQEDLTASERAEVVKLVRAELKGDKFDDRTLKAIKNGLTSLFQTLYVRRGFWRSDLSIAPQS